MIVVGAGGTHGSSTLYHLAKRGVKARLPERGEGGERDRNLDGSRVSVPFARVWRDKGGARRTGLFGVGWGRGASGRVVPRGQRGPWPRVVGGGRKGDARVGARRGRRGREKPGERSPGRGPVGPGRATGEQRAGDAGVERDSPLTLLSPPRSCAQVLGLESQPSAPHANGSHGGETRVTRLSYFEHPAYVPLLKRSFELWRELEAETGRTIYLNCGCANIAAANADAEGSVFRGALQSALEHGLEHEVLVGPAITARFPAITVPPGAKALFEKAGGVIYPAEAIAGALERARALGARVEFSARVAAWGPEVGGAAPCARCAPGERCSLYRVSLADGRSFVAKKLVLIPGAWVGDLVPELAPALEVQRQVIAWFAVRPEHRALFESDRLPSYLLDGELGDAFYCFPIDKYGFKIGKMYHLKERVSDPSTYSKAITPADEAVLREGIKAYAPLADNEMTKAVTCLFTMTPDHDFVVDFHPRHGKDVVVVSACSGHGFKFASVMGELLADLATKGETPFDIDLFAISDRRKGFGKVVQALNGPAQKTKL